MQAVHQNKKFISNNNKILPLLNVLPIQFFISYKILYNVPCVHSTRTRKWRTFTPERNCLKAFTQGIITK